MKVWITKYALTMGVYSADVEECGSGTVKDHAEYVSFYHGEGREWHRTRERAVERALVMRDDKLRSLQKQIKKLQAMTFEVGDE